MSHPFGGHPTLESFIGYAVKNGCSPYEDIDLSGDIMKRLKRIDGKIITIPLQKSGEMYLAPALVRNLCENLGIPQFHGLG